ncbi:MAG: thioredoxin [Clostridia bacterium]|nr:thioredoxin [Clostridia bacterium]
MAEITITKDNFEQEVLQSAKPVLVDFWAPWCGPCKMLAPVIADIAAEYADQVKVGKVNVDEEAELAMQFRVASIPTVILFEGGKVKQTAVGFRSKSDLIEMFL